MKGGLRGAVAFAAALVVLLTACAGSSKVQTLVPGVLRVGSSLDFKPFEYFQAQPGRAKVLKGFDVELVQDMANRLDLYVRWVDSDFATIFNSLASNNLDMVAAATTITPTREQTVNFSNPYFLANQSLTVNVGKTPDITSTDNLGAGDIVAVQNGSTGASWAQENLVPQGVQLKRFNLTTDMFTELDAGTVTGVIDDEPASRAVVADMPNLKVVQVIDTGEHYGFAVSKSNGDLLRAANSALDQIMADGTYAKIFTRFFPGQEVPAQFQG